MSKCIVLDLDGTLLRDDKTVSEDTINALLKFKEQNNKILFATARPPRMAYKYVPERLRDNPIICYNGACMIDSERNILYKKEINRDDTLKIIKIAKNFGYNKICLEIKDTLYSNFDVTEFFGNVLNKILDLETMKFETVYKIIICNSTPISKDLLDEISKICKGIITDNGTLCQVIAKEVSKWSGIKSWIKQENISDKNVIAFGDDFNDYEMIKNAGIGVAMENAEEEIKKIANFITDSNMNESVSNFIIKNLLFTDKTIID